MKALLSIIISGALVVSGFGQTRNVLVGTNNAVVQPTNFWSADASNARTGLGLGPTDSPQLNRVILSNGNAGSPSVQIGTNNKGMYGQGNVLLFSIGGTSVASISASTIAAVGDITAVNTGQTRTNFGLVWEGLTNADASSFRTALGLGTAATNPASAFQASSANLTNLAANNGGSLTNLQATNLVGTIPASNISTVNFTNIGGTLSVASGGTGATNAANARQNLGSTTVGDAVFIATNAAAARTAIGALSTNGSALGLTNFPTVPLASNVTGTIAISNGGSGATTAGGARTNLGLGATNDVAFQNASLDGGQLNLSNGAIYWLGDARYEPETQTFQGDVTFENGSLSIVGTNAAAKIASTRTNLGLGWSALTNTTASGFQTALFGTGTNPVLVNTNGEVVSPTNFWQAAPITTTFIESQPTTNSSTNISPSRLLHIHSLATNIVNVTNTIVLPTNTLTFEGDMAMVVHKGSTNSLTQVRQAGSTNNIITLNKFNEAVEFTYYNNNWQFLETAAFTAPIYFSGTNASANAAASRTNLGLGTIDNVTFNSLQLGAGTNTALFIYDEQTIFGDGVLYFEAGQIVYKTPIEFNNATNAATTRTNLGLGATNDVVFNQATFSGPVTFNEDVFGSLFEAASGSNSVTLRGQGIEFFGTSAATTRTNLGLGTTNAVTFGSLSVDPIGTIIVGTDGTNSVGINISQSGIEFEGNRTNGLISFIGTNLASTFRSDIGLGATNIVTFAGLTNNGDITINQTATNNGLLYIYRTNAEPFLGLANLIASNNVTVSNETLFRVGVAEATNRSAQFGFRSTNTNGNGVAVFSVFGYNALMMIGPSDPNAGTNPIQATVYSVSPTNKVMTLITTNTGATLFHRPIEFETTNQRATTRTNLGLGGGITTNLILKNSANVDTYMNFSNGILIYGSTNPP